MHVALRSRTRTRRLGFDRPQVFVQHLIQLHARQGEKPLHQLLLTDLAHVQAEPDPLWDAPAGIRSRLFVQRGAVCCERSI